MLKAEHIKRPMGKDANLGPINFTAEPGTITAIAGNNGAGKTTFFQAISGDYPGSGRTLVNGNNIHTIEGKTSFSYVPQLYPELEPFTLKQLRSLHKEHDLSWRDDRFQAFVRRFNLKLTKPIKKMSVGMKQKAVIALQLSRDTSVLILDEPFSGLDMEGQQQLEKLLFYALNEKPETTIIIATHVADEVQRLADYICFMNGGQLSAPVEKDALQERWQWIWLEEPVANVGKAPGVREVEAGPTPQILTSNAPETEQWLLENDAKIMKRSRLRLHESIPRILRNLNEDIGGTYEHKQHSSGS